MSATSDGRIIEDRLAVAEPLHRFVATELTEGTGVSPTEFWVGFQAMVADLAPRLRTQLARRDELQQLIDDWHRERTGRPHDPEAYQQFLHRIGYLGDAPPSAIAVTTGGVDRELCDVAGPQLVVPLDNARFALNAANARWGSLYDALYGTDVVPEGDGCAAGAAYNPVRGDRVVAFGRDFLDRHFGLAQGTHHHATDYAVIDGALSIRLGDGTTSRLLQPSQLAGYQGDPASPASVLLVDKGLHVDVRFDPDSVVGRRDLAGVHDLVVESAVTTIMDCEDSVAAVDADDKLVVYRNWLGLMRGDLRAVFTRDGTEIDRRLHPDRQYMGVTGSSFSLPGRSLMLVRNVGHHIDTDAVTIDGEPVPETILDAMVTSLAAKHDLLGLGEHRNSRTGSVYIVKPKMHGPDEVALAVELFARVEDVLGLDRATLKIGIMDEERRMSVNLAASITAASDRLVFINTGFLDRTGDEIHTSIEAGPMITKPAMKGATWLSAYEDSNVDVGIACGLPGRAQIGKGMWAVPAEMAAMLREKIGHPMAGASTAWVPSPTAATLHALHYHQLDVAARQRELASRPPRPLADMLTVPLLADPGELDAEAIQRELENNVQGILGYVARWVGQGVGCSTVSDIDDVGLMEDRATLRISSQHVANWLHHGIVSERQVRDTMAVMAGVVDHQNRLDPAHRPMTDDLAASIPFQASLDLVFEGRTEPNGYTEAILFRRRREMKASLDSQ
jgi:malate synthase